MRMRTRMFSLLSLPLVCSLVSPPALASTSMVLHLTGTVQGPILGSSTTLGHDNWIDVLSYSWGTDIPIAPNGLPTGPAKPSPLSLMKAFDRSSIKLLISASTEEIFTTFSMEFVASGGPAAYFKIDLAGARIMDLQQSGSSEPPIESVSLVYTTITFTDVVQGISVSYNWGTSGSTASATEGMLARGILLPPAPNPTPGETQFRFSVPSGSNADLTLFDMQGRVVRELRHGRITDKSVVTVWDGTDDRGTKVAPGIYMARLTYPDAVITQRFAVVR